MQVVTREICPQCQGTGHIEVVREEKVSAEDVESRERHHGVGAGGLHPNDEAVPTIIEDHAGLGSEGEKKP